MSCFYSRANSYIQPGKLGTLLYNGGIKYPPFFGQNVKFELKRYLAPLESPHSGLIYYINII